VGAFLIILMMALRGAAPEAPSNIHVDPPAAKAPVADTMTVAQEKLPAFDDYPVDNQFEGKPALPHIVTKEASLYRTAIKEQAANGPNFAGHYTIIEIGCGAACAQFAVVDARTGDVLFQPFNLVYGAEDQRELQEKYDPQYRLNSRLLVAFGSIKTKGKRLFFYKWEGDRFKLVHSSIKKD